MVLMLSSHDTFNRGSAPSQPKQAQCAWACKNQQINSAHTVVLVILEAVPQEFPIALLYKQRRGLIGIQQHIPLPNAIH